jgi:hypothetical protein
MSHVGHRLCADASRGDALVSCWCGNLRPAKREHGWTREAAPLVVPYQTTAPCAKRDCTARATKEVLAPGGHAWVPLCAEHAVE